MKELEMLLLGAEVVCKIRRLQDADDSYGILRESGFDDRFREETGASSRGVVPRPGPKEVRDPEAPLPVPETPDQTQAEIPLEVMVDPRAHVTSRKMTKARETLPETIVIPPGCPVARFRVRMTETAVPPLPNIVLNTMTTTTTTFPRFDGGFSRPPDFPRNGDNQQESSRNDRGPSQSRGDSPSRPQDRDRGSSSSGRRPQHGDFPRGDGGSSRPHDIPRDDDDGRESSRNDRGPSHSPGGSASRPRDRDRGSSSSGRRPQLEDEHPPRGQGSRDEEGFRGRPEYSRGPHNSSDPLRGTNRREEFPHRERVPSPGDFVVSTGNQQGPRGNSPTQGFQGPERFPTNQESRDPQRRYPEGPRRNLGPDQLSGPEKLIPGPQQVFPIPEPQPFPRDQGFSGGSQQTSRTGGLSRPQEFPRGQGLPDGRLTLLASLYK
ncbi:hypothetical protein HPB51_004971 [Rhipicephalus microplus]|uniref:Uncharacterized protein n=1 Tax=Rhipicephalus microplus TaxID=6941 RepID=A0A9J6EXA2_RHIMP|nr:hypothetical protein HPB51_004971 [Rhipicephalus microplus]